MSESIPGREREWDQLRFVTFLLANHVRRDLFHFPSRSLFVSPQFTFIPLPSSSMALACSPSAPHALPWLDRPSPAAAAREWPLCLFCFVSSTSSSPSSSSSLLLLLLHLSPYFWVLWIWRSHKNGNTKLSAITAMHRLWNPRRPLS